MMSKDLCRSCVFADHGVNVLKDAWTNEVISTNITRRCFNKKHKQQYQKSVLQIKTMCIYYQNKTLGKTEYPLTSYYQAFRKMCEVREKMVKIKSDVVEAIEPAEGQTYIIEAVDEIKTNVQSYNGLRVSMTDLREIKTDISKRTRYTTMLWLRDEASQNSKLGSFLQAFKDYLGDGEEYQDTDNWIENKVKFIKWQNKSREIKVLA